MKMMIRPDCVEHLARNATSMLECNTKIASVQEGQKPMQSLNQKAENSYPECAASKGENHPPTHLDQTKNSKLSSLAQSTLPGNSESSEKLGNHQVLPETNPQVTKLEPLSQSADALSQCPSSLGQCSDDNLVVKPTNLSNLVNDSAFPDQNSNPLPLQTSPRMMMQGQLDTHLLQSQQIDVPQVEYLNANGLISYPEDSEWNVYPSPYQPLAGFLRSPGSSSSLLRKHDHHPAGAFSGPAAATELTPIEELWNNQMSNAKCHLQLPQQDLPNLHTLSNSFALKELSEQSPNQSDIYSCLNFDGSNSGSTVVDPSISSTALDEFSTLKNADFHNPSDFLVGNLSQDVQSQLTSASLADSQGFSLQEFVDNSGGASSSNVEFDDSNILANNSSWQQAAPRVRTYTKVNQLLGNS